MTPLRPFHRGAMGAVVLIVLSLFGCARINLQSLRNGQSNGEIQAIDGADAALGPVYGFEISTGSGQPTRLLCKLEGQLLLQQALDKGKIREKYGEVEVMLLRLPADDQPPVRMKVVMENGRVAYDTDYAIHPGDRIMVQTVGRSIL